MKSRANFLSLLDIWVDFHLARHDGHIEINEERGNIPFDYFLFVSRVVKSCLHYERPYVPILYRVTYIFG